MTIHHPTLFKVSFSVAILSAIQIALTYSLMEALPAGDFNFGPAFLIMMALAQIALCIYGIYQSLQK